MFIRATDSCGRVLPTKQEVGFINKQRKYWSRCGWKKNNGISCLLFYFSPFCFHSNSFASKTATWVFVNFTSFSLGHKGIRVVWPYRCHRRVVCTTTDILRLPEWKKEKTCRWKHALPVHEMKHQFSRLCLVSRWKGKRVWGFHSRGVAHRALQVKWSGQIKMLVLKHFLLFFSLSPISTQHERNETETSCTSANTRKYFIHFNSKEKSWKEKKSNKASRIFCVLVRCWLSPWVFQISALTKPFKCINGIHFLINPIYVRISSSFRSLNIPTTTAQPNGVYPTNYFIKNITNFPSREKKQDRETWRWRGWARIF